MRVATMSNKPPRKSFDESCQILRDLGFIKPDEQPVIPPCQPKYEDEEPLGVSFFRWIIEDMILADLTLPRTYFGKSEFINCAFRNCDLNDSNLIWNDFKQIDFSHSNLSNSDMRGSVFDSCSFVKADLTSADLRQSSFNGCKFTGARMKGAKVEDYWQDQLPWTKQQMSDIDWQDDPGPDLE